MDQINEESPYSKNTIAIVETPPATPILPALSRSCSDSRWSDTSFYCVKKKHKSWCQLPNGNWVMGNILSTSGAESIISLLDGKVLKVNTNSIQPANPDILDGVDDLIQLSYINEPSVLYNLEYRYSKDLIYTKAGPVLVAINPFKEIPLYGNDYIEAYRRNSLENPHVYTIADTAIREMIRDEVNQNIIIRNCCKSQMQHMHLATWCWEILEFISSSRRPISSSPQMNH